MRPPREGFVRVWPGTFFRVRVLAPMREGLPVTYRLFRGGDILAGGNWSNVERILGKVLGTGFEYRDDPDIELLPATEKEMEEPLVRIVRRRR